MKEALQLIEIERDSSGIATDFTFLCLNSAFEKQTGAKLSDVLGKKATELGQVIEPYWTDIWDKVEKTGVPEHYDNYNQVTNRYYSSYSFKLSKNIIAVLYTDITEYKKAQEQTELFSILFEIATDAIFVIDLDGKILLFNETAYKQRGYSKEEMSEMTLFTLDTPEAAELINSRLENLLKAGEATFESEHLKKDGTRMPVEIHSRRIELEGKKVFLSVMRDITERKQAEESLRKAQKKLSEYATNLAKLVDERTKELKEKERLAAIGETAGMVGHDLRNPLQSIVSDLFLAETELIEMPDSENKCRMVEAIKGITEQVNYMDKIVSDLQTFVKSVKPVKQTVDLKEFIPALIFTQTIPQSIKITFQLPDKTNIIADTQLLKRVSINLITNAVQAMPQGGALTIRVILNENQVRIIVEDTGMGISDEIKPKIFTPLFTTKAKGQGFGLAVCKRVLEAQGGTITFETEVGKGTKFIIELPLIE
jgi:PAS domain S-box